MDVCERSAPIGCGSAVTSRCHAPPLHACALGVQRNLGAEGASRSCSLHSTSLAQVPREGPRTAGVTRSAPCFTLTSVVLVPRGRCSAPSRPGLVPAAGAWTWILSARVWSQTASKVPGSVISCLFVLVRVCPRACLFSALPRSAVRCSVTSPPVLRSVNAPDVPVGDANSFRDVTRASIKLR